MATHGGDLSTETPPNEDSFASPNVVPLRQRQQDGRPYTRPADIIAAIYALSQLSKEEFAKRIDPQNSDDIVPSECLLYFVRRPPFEADKDVLWVLFTAIRQRVLKAVPVPIKSGKGQRSIDLDIREAVSDKFNELLCRDQTEYQERLDFFEFRFNLAIARLRATARRDICRDVSHFVPLAHDNETNETSPEVEKALSCFTDSFGGPSTDSSYRSKIHFAISSLPPDERRVVELFMEGIPIESSETDMTMVKILDCCEKTVRNRRDRAFAKIAILLKEEQE